MIAITNLNFHCRYFLNDVNQRIGFIKCQFKDMSVFLISFIKNGAEKIECEIRSTAKKLQFLSKQHFQQRRNIGVIGTHKVLVNTKNKSMRDVVLNELGYKTALEFRKTIFDKNFYKKMN